MARLYHPAGGLAAPAARGPFHEEAGGRRDRCPRPAPVHAPPPGGPHGRPPQRRPGPAPCIPTPPFVIPNAVRDLRLRDAASGAGACRTDPHPGRRSLPGAAPRLLAAFVIPQRAPRGTSRLGILTASGCRRCRGAGTVRDARRCRPGGVSLQALSRGGAPSYRRCPRGDRASASCGRACSLPTGRRAGRPGGAAAPASGRDPGVGDPSRRSG